MQADIAFEKIIRNIAGLISQCMGEKTECGVRNAESVFKIFLHTWR